jgi:hypothetical protein
VFISKLIEPQLARVSTAPMLFDTRDDPTGSKDVFDSNRALAREIHSRSIKWLEEAGTPEDHLAGRRGLC